MNKVILIGNLGGSVTLRKTPGGKMVGNVSLATNERWTDRNGKSQDRATWHQLVIWEKRAEVMAKHLQSGSKIMVEGRIQNSSYEKDGITRYTSEVVVENFEFLEPKAKAEAPAQPEAQEPPF